MQANFNGQVLFLWLKVALWFSGSQVRRIQPLLHFLQAKFDVQVLFLRLKVALGDKRAAVIKELCELLASALESPDGIPRQLMEAADQAAAELVNIAALYHGLSRSFSRVLMRSVAMYLESSIRLETQHKTSCCRDR